MIPWYEKIGIGAVGALCLGLLKLISAQFYLAAPSSKAATAAYLTYASYLILGMAVALFLADNDPDKQKTRKSAFVMGLLAPSILIAMISEPFKTPQSQTGSTENVKELSASFSLFGLTAYAQESFPTNRLQRIEGTTIETNFLNSIKLFDEDAVVPGYEAGFRAALGLKNQSKDHVFIVGKTDDRATALRNAAKINAFLRNSGTTNSELKAQIIQPRNAKTYYLAIGDFGTARKVQAAQSQTEEAAIKFLPDTSLKEDRDTAKLILQGQVLKGEAFFKKE